VSVDLSRVASAAVAAALDDGKPRRRGLTGIRAVVLGAALGTAARVAVARAPVPDFARLPDLVRDRLADRGLLPDDEEDFQGDEDAPEAEASDEEPAADSEPQPEEEEPEGDEEPQSEEEPEGDEEPHADEEPQAEEEEPEGDEEPQADEELQADEEEEPQAEEEPETEEPDADSEGDDTPDLLGALSGGRRRVRPARRPPKAPKSAEAGS